MGVFAALFGAANAFSPVAVFGALVPKDGGVTVTRDIAYGPLPRHILDVYRPDGDQADRPVIFFSYGGGWESGEKADYAFVGRAFAARGYITVIADYRVVPDVVYPDFVSDNALAVSWLRENVASFGGDAETLFLMGHSAGAYNVMMLALDPQFGVADAPISGVVGLSGPYDFYPFDVSASQNAFGSFDQPEQTQPVNLVRGDAPPTLLLHGDSDDTVRPRNSTALAQGLTAAGASAEIKIYEGANHADTLVTLSIPLRWRYPVFEDVLAFLATHGGGGN